MTLNWQSRQPALLSTSILYFLLRKLVVYSQIPLGMLKQEKVRAQLSHTLSVSLPVKIHKGRYSRQGLSTKLDILTNLGNCSDLFLDLNCSSVIYLNQVIKKIVREIFQNP